MKDYKSAQGLVYKQAIHRRRRDIYFLIDDWAGLGSLSGDVQAIAVYARRRTWLGFEKELQREISLTKRDGSPYRSLLETDELGLRESGDRNRAALKILVLGNSVTADPFAGNNEMWYSVAARKLERTLAAPQGSIFVYAGGGGGYGTLQNLILMKRLKNQTRPDLFILQFCSNDFMNNHKEWESVGAVIVRPQFLRRPYFGLDRKISFSDKFYAPLWRIPIVGDSRLLAFIDGVIQGFQFERYGGYGPKLDVKRQEEFNEEALLITSELLAELRKEIPGTPAVLVNCSSELTDVNRHWKRIATDAGFIPLSEPSDRIEQNKSNSTLFSKDGTHLSPEGNFQFGEAVADALSSRNLVKMPQAR